MRYDTAVGIVSEWRGNKDGVGGRAERKEKTTYRLSSSREYPSTPSLRLFNVGSGDGSNLALGRSRTLTPGGLTFTIISGGELDERGRPRLRRPKRPVPATGSVQEMLGAGSRSAPPLRPPIAVPPRQPAQEPPPTNNLPRATLPPTSVLGPGSPASPIVLPQA